MKAKGLKMKIGKTKVMVSGKNQGDVESLGSSQVLYVLKRVLGIILSDVRVAMDGYTGGAQV